MNTNKTKEMIVDFKRTGSKPKTVSFLVKEVEVVDELLEQI